MNGPALVARARVTHLLGSVVDGVVLSTIVVHATTVLGFAPTAVGLVLTTAAAASLITSVPMGLVADALGPYRAAIGLGTGSAVALVIYATTTSIWGLVVGAVLFGTTQAGLGAVRLAVAAAATEPADRVRIRATMHVMLNAGMGLGTLLGVLALHVDIVRWVYLLGAAVAGSCVLLLRDVPPSARSAGPASPWDPAVLRDRHFITVTGAAGLVQLTMPVLSVLLPVWVIERTSAPIWSAAAALGLNTVLVLLGQTSLSTRVYDARTARGAALISSTCLVAATALLGTAAVPGAGLALLLVLGGTITLTAGEILGGAATWQLAFSSVPSGQHAQRQSTFALAPSFARVAGPVAALPLVLGLGLIGWLAIGLVMAGGCLVLVALTHRDLTPMAVAV